MIAKEDRRSVAGPNTACHYKANVLQHFRKISPDSGLLKACLAGVGEDKAPTTKKKGIENSNVSCTRCRKLLATAEPGTKLRVLSVTPRVGKPAEFKPGPSSWPNLVSRPAPVTSSMRNGNRISEDLHSTRFDYSLLASPLVMRVNRFRRLLSEVRSGAAQERKGGGNGRSRENPTTRDIVRNESHIRISAGDPAGNRTRFANAAPDDGKGASIHSEIGNPGTVTSPSNVTNQNIVGLPDTIVLLLYCFHYLVRTQTPYPHVPRWCTSISLRLIECSRPQFNTVCSLPTLKAVQCWDTEIGCAQPARSVYLIYSLCSCLRTHHVDILYAIYRNLYSVRFSPLVLYFAYRACLPTHGIGVSMPPTARELLRSSPAAITVPQVETITRSRGSHFVIHATGSSAAPARESGENYDARKRLRLWTVSGHRRLSCAGAAFAFTPINPGAAVIQWLDYAPPTKTIPDSISGGAAPRSFACGNRVRRCRWSAGFLGVSSFPRPSIPGAAPCSTSTFREPMRMKRGLTSRRQRGHERPDTLLRQRRDGEGIGHGLNEVSIEQRWDESAGETADPGKNAPTIDIVRHDSHTRKSTSDPSENRTRNSTDRKAAGDLRVRGRGHLTVGCHGRPAERLVSYVRARRRLVARADSWESQSLVCSGGGGRKVTRRGALSVGAILRPVATVAEWLACLPPTTANRVQFPAGSPDFRKWESCRTMPLVGGFSRGIPVSPALSFRRRSILISITLIDSQDLACSGSTSTTKVGHAYVMTESSRHTWAKKPRRHMKAERTPTTCAGRVITAAAQLARAGKVTPRHSLELQVPATGIVDQPGKDSDKTRYVGDDTGQEIHVMRLRNAKRKVDRKQSFQKCSIAVNSAALQTANSQGIPQYDVARSLLYTLGAPCRLRKLNTFRHSLASSKGPITRVMWRQLSSYVLMVEVYTGKQLVVSLLATHEGESDSIPDWVTPGFSQEGIVPDDALGRRVFSGSPSVVLPERDTCRSGEPEECTRKRENPEKTPTPRQCPPHTPHDSIRRNISRPSGPVVTLETSNDASGIATTHCEKSMGRNPLHRPAIGDNYDKQRADIGQCHAGHVVFPHQDSNERRSDRDLGLGVGNIITGNGRASADCGICGSGTHSESGPGLKGSSRVCSRQPSRRTLTEMRRIDRRREKPDSTEEERFDITPGATKLCAPYQRNRTSNKRELLLARLIIIMTEFVSYKATSVDEIAKTKRFHIRMLGLRYIIYAVQRHEGNTARLARRIDEALEVRISVARIAPSLLDLGRGGQIRHLLYRSEIFELANLYAMLASILWVRLFNHCQYKSFHSMTWCQENPLTRAQRSSRAPPSSPRHLWFLLRSGSLMVGGGGVDSAFEAEKPQSCKDAIATTRKALNWCKEVQCWDMEIGCAQAARSVYLILSLCCDAAKVGGRALQARAESAAVRCAMQSSSKAGRVVRYSIWSSFSTRRADNVLRSCRGDADTVSTGLRNMHRELLVRIVAHG
ncbi:hypothetical protein PR048_000818 [Dryococelus australis]|uniref:Uncharacterized protein n=1 Tax=Dryococelus australis TaxID=614101 RepID=A0ABQ9IFN9_9NEOP|nr:hypothetical protein PR048_000818 [Dryococelus australis]